MMDDIDEEAKGWFLMASRVCDSSAARNARPDKSSSSRQ